jgi:hypothetical protein
MVPEFRWTGELEGAPVEESRVDSAWRRERSVGAGEGSGGTIVVVVGILVNVRSRLAGRFRRPDEDLARP